MQALGASESRLLKAGKRHWQQLKERAALNQLVAEKDPFQAAVDVATVCCHLLQLKRAFITIMSWPSTIIIIIRTCSWSIIIIISWTLRSSVAGSMS
jgi:hypothetical protein